MSKVSLRISPLSKSQVICEGEKKLGNFQSVLGDSDFPALGRIVESQEETKKHVRKISVDFRGSGWQEKEEKDTEERGKEKDMESEFLMLGLSGSQEENIDRRNSVSEDPKIRESQTRVGTEDLGGDQEEDSSEGDNLDELFGFDLASSSGVLGVEESSAVSLRRETKQKSFRENRTSPHIRQQGLNSFSGPLPPLNDSLVERASGRLLRRAAEPFRPRGIFVGGGESGYEILPDRIGSDIRTTVYVRHIPNKYTKEMMLATIDEKFKGTYDFFYLPIDFTSGSNVGYAFINFTSLDFLREFYKVFHGKKWAFFNSEKICELRYARIQGKTQCEKHFEHSLLMSQPIQNYKPFLRGSDPKRNFNGLAK